MLTAPLHTFDSVASTVHRLLRSNAKLPPLLARPCPALARWSLTKAALRCCCVRLEACFELCLALAQRHQQLLGMGVPLYLKMCGQRTGRRCYLLRGDLNSISALVERRSCSCRCPEPCSSPLRSAPQPRKHMPAFDPLSALPQCVTQAAEA